MIMRIIAKIKGMLVSKPPKKKKMPNLDFLNGTLGFKVIRKRPLAILTGEINRGG